MTETGQTPERQTPAQWAVRWHGVALFALLVLSVPVWHLTWHVALGHEDPPVRTRSEKKWPPFSADGFFGGDWMLRLEDYLEGASPIVWQLRGFYNEQRHRLGIYHSHVIRFGKDDWVYAGHTIEPDLAGFAAARDARLAFLRDVRQRAEDLGLFLLVTVVPDKVRIHPEPVWPGGRMPEEREQVYGRMLAEFGEAGIATVDLAAVLTNTRRVTGEPMFYERDTHWRPRGALVAQQAVAAAIERAVSVEALGPRLPFELGPAQSVRAISDLVATGGFRTFEVDAGGEFPLTLAASGWASRMAETKDYYHVVARGPDGPIDVLGGAMADATRVLLAGTSFAGDNGWNALMLALGRPVDQEIIPGADGLEPLFAQLAKAARSPGRYRVLVWEVVERGMFATPWRRPRLPPP